MWREWFICDMTHAYATWLMHMWYDSFICDTHTTARCTFVVSTRQSGYLIVCVVAVCVVAVCVVVVCVHVYCLGGCCVCGCCVCGCCVCGCWVNNGPVSGGCDLCDMTRSHATWLVHMGHDSFIWDLTRSYGHDSVVVHTLCISCVSYIVHVLCKCLCIVTTYAFLCIRCVVHQKQYALLCMCCGCWVWLCISRACRVQHNHICIGVLSIRSIHAQY